MATALEDQLVAVERTSTLRRGIFAYTCTYCEYCQAIKKVMYQNMQIIKDGRTI